jgi:hypothetical protein
MKQGIEAVACIRVGNLGKGPVKRVLATILAKLRGVEPWHFDPASRVLNQSAYHTPASDRSIPR